MRKIQIKEGGLLVDGVTAESKRKEPDWGGTGRAGQPKTQIAREKGHLSFRKPMNRWGAGYWGEKKKRLVGAEGTLKSRASQGEKPGEEGNQKGGSRPRGTEGSKNKGQPRRGKEKLPETREGPKIWETHPTTTGNSKVKGRPRQTQTKKRNVMYRERKHNYVKGEEEEGGAMEGTKKGALKKNAQREVREGRAAKETEEKNVQKNLHQKS